MESELLRAKDVETKKKDSGWPRKKACEQELTRKSRCDGHFEQRLVQALGSGSAVGWRCVAASVSVSWIAVGERREARAGRDRDKKKWMNSSSEGFDPGSERTLAAWMRHASRT
eukprot:TRINITY_DN5034_c0_g1_i1.p2 TRINITY_DN5034_c0_g1~~TRINITY_DN5034_c0_g1_i1.p2  ORF type:complete len:128 (-),score=19.67 TRINITY_DN5034_c0_g1_i1:60-401(-)